MVITLFILSCAADEKSKKTFINELNGNYVKGPETETKESALANLLYIGDKGRTSSIQGRCVQEVSGQNVLLRGRPYKLFNRSGVEVFAGQTNHDGTFQLSEKLDDGDYYIVVYADRFKLRKKFQLKGFETKLGDLKLERY